MVKALQVVTGVILTAFAVYLGAWYAGAIEGSLEAVLRVTTLVSGAYWIADRLVFLPRRRGLANMLVGALSPRPGGAAPQDLQARAQHDGMDKCRKIVMERPWWLCWAGIFPVMAVIFVLRFFAFEPFLIPSSAMSPTLRLGDMVLVNKYAYGLRLPVWNARLGGGSPPQRGDVILFRYLLRPGKEYIRRIVGLPGDEVAYLNKRLSINGKRLPASYAGDFFSRRAGLQFKQFEEQLGSHRHRVIHHDDRPASVRGALDFAFKDQCSYPGEGIVCKVPAGQYFTMGDNRDNAPDSRIWGFVPERDIIGKAFFVWMNFDNFEQIGQIK